MKFHAKVGIAVITVGFFLAAVVFWRTDFTGLLWEASRQGEWLLPLVLVAAGLDSINPCAFSVLILTIAFLFSVGQLRAKVLTVGLFFIFGIFLAYMSIGLGILQVLHIFDTPHFMGKIGAIVLILFGLLNVVNVLFPSFPIKLKIPQVAHNKMADLMNRVSAPAAFGLGILVGLCEFPCTGGPYLMVLGLLHDSATFYTGFAYLLLYNVIFVLPLLIILGLAGSRRSLDKIQTWQKNHSRSMRLYGGALMVILGLAVLSMML